MAVHIKNEGRYRELKGTFEEVFGYLHENREFDVRTIKIDDLGNYTVVVFDYGYDAKNT